MKKIISIFIAVAMLLSLTVSAFATDTTPTLTVSSATAQVGDQVVLEVSMTEATFAAFGLQILYDEEALELKKIEKGEIMDDFFAFTGSKKTGKVTAFNTEDLDVEGVLFTMTFNVLSEGEHTVELDIDSFNHDDESVLEVTAVAGTISVPSAEPELPEVENPIVIGDNVIELPMDAPEASVYNFVATETGTLYIAAVDFQYCASWTNGEYMDNTEYMSDWTEYTVFSVNGEALPGGFYGSVDVVAGEVYTFTWEHNAYSTYGYKATINLSYSDELIPEIGVDIELTPEHLPMNTVEIGAGEEVLYKISYAFSGYVLQIFGENAYIYYEFYDWWSGESVTRRIDAVDGVVEFDLDKHGTREFYIGNAGTEAASFPMDYYAPAGGPNNPIEVENLEDISVSATAGEEFFVYFKWTANKLGTITVVSDGINISFYNMTKEEYGEYDNTWVNYSIYVEPGDILEIAVGGYANEDTVYNFQYTFVEGYRLGTEQNPFQVDLIAGMDVNLYDETVYYTWTPAETMTVTLDFTLLYTWSTNEPTVTINGEPYTLGEELTVTAGEPIILVLSTVPSVYGTLQATKVETEDPVDPVDPVEPIEPEIPEGGEIFIEETVTVPASWMGTTKSHEMTEDGTLILYITSCPADTTVEYAFFVKGASKTYNHTHEDGFTQTIEVLAGDTVKLELCVLALENGTMGAYVGGDVAYTLVFVPAESGGEDPVEPEVIYEGSMDVETTDTYGYFDLFTLTAPVAGTYTINVPAGLGVWSLESYLNWGMPEIDFYDNTEGFSFTVELTEGEEFSFYVGATTKATWTITYTVTEAEQGEDPVDPVDPIIPEDAVDLIIGNNSINAADVTFVYTAPSAGTLILNMGMSIMGPVEAEVTVNFANAQTLSTMGRIELALNAGDVVLVTVTASGYATMTAEWETEGSGEEPECEHEFVDGVCIKCGEEDPNYVPPTEPDGSMNNPFIIDQLPFEATQETTDDLYYQWTATEDGTLYVYYADGMVSLSGNSVGTWEYTDGGKYVEVVAGDVIVINYWNGTGFTAEFVSGSEAEPGSSTNPIEMESLNMTLTAEDDGIYYAWIATETGDVVIRIADCTWSYGYSLTINGESLFGAGSELTISVVAGDQVIIKIDVYPSASSDGYLTLEQVVEEHVCEFVITDSKDATCTEAGFVTYTCSCGETYTEEVPALGHSYEAVVTEPTCVDAGFTTYTCSVCGDTYVADEVPALGHSWDDGVVTVEPTEEAEGEKVFTCQVCGETKTETIPTLDHVHNYEAVVTEPTCTEPGFTTYTCACGDTYVADEVAALGHSYEAVVTEPTCVDAGFTTYTCSVCGDTYVGDEVAALGHTYEVTDSKEATCVEAGYVTYTCACGDTYTEEVPATGEHTYENGACTVCGAEDPNPGTGSMNVLAIALIAMMSVTAVVVTANKKSDEE